LLAAVWADVPRSSIRGRVVGADGTAGGSEFAVSVADAANLKRHRPSVAQVQSNFAVAWLEEALNPPGPPPGVKLQRFDSSARPLGPELQINGSDVDTSHAPSLSRLVDGGFVVTWLGTRADRRVMIRRYSPDGAARGDEHSVSSAEGRHVRPLVTMLDGGNFVVAWTKDPVAPGGGGLAMQVFDHDGVPVSEALEPNVFGPHAIAPLDGGRFVVVHLKRGPQSDLGVETNAVRGDVFNGDGVSANVPLFLGDARGTLHSSPWLASVGNGERVVVSWLQKSAETVATTTTLRAAVVSIAQGATVGAEIQVDAAPQAERFQARVATVPGDGSGEAAAFVWDHGDGSDSGVRARVVAINAGGGFT
jgi:hypothetical protein